MHQLRQRPPADRLVAELTGLGLRASLRHSDRVRASKDYAWLSPVLSGRLPPEAADAVVWPASASQLAAAVGLAHAAGMPVTPRGRGTGNYGQAVPLHGGLVIDFTAMDAIVAVTDGAASVEPGVTCAAVERAARRAGQELTVFPSTVHSTVGGFLAGGAGGSGSIEHGFVWDGLVTSLDVVDCCDRPALTSLSGDDLAAHLHAYGTTGLIAGATLRLAPARRWVGVAASFASFESAAAAAASLLDECDGIRVLGVSDAALAATFPSRSWLPAGRASLRAVVTNDSVALLTDLAVAHGGTVDATGAALVGDVTALSYNHVTLRAKRADPGICHLQVGGPALPASADAVRAVLPEGRLHLDAMRGPDGRGFGGLLISRFTSADALNDAIADLRAMRVFVVDPHTWAVSDPDGRRAEAARRFDPDGLLNPGKLARP